MPLSHDAPTRRTGVERLGRADGQWVAFSCAALVQFKSPSAARPGQSRKGLLGQTRDRCVEPLPTISSVRACSLEMK